METPCKKELKCIKYAKRFYKTSLINNLFNKTKYSVSERSSFSQLWSDYGLRDTGSGYLHRGPFQKQDKIKCIEFWIATLYDTEVDLESWLSEIENDLMIQARLFYQHNPGVHIKMQKSEDLIIDKIDEKFGLYKRD